MQFTEKTVVEVVELELDAEIVDEEVEGTVVLVDVELVESSAPTMEVELELLGDVVVDEILVDEILVDGDDVVVAFGSGPSKA